MALRALAGGCDGGGSRRGCGFCLHWSQNCLCPGLARKMLDGHLFQLLLTTALFPSILGTGTAPFLPLLLPELFPDGALALEGCSPEAQKGGWGGLCWEAVVCSERWGSLPGMVAQTCWCWGDSHCSTSVGSECCPCGVMGNREGVQHGGGGLR